MFFNPRALQWNFSFEYLDIFHWIFTVILIELLRMCNPNRKPNEMLLSTAAWPGNLFLHLNEFLPKYNIVVGERYWGCVGVPEGNVVFFLSTYWQLLNKEDYIVLQICPICRLHTVCSPSIFQYLFCNIKESKEITSNMRIWSDQTCMTFLR